MDSSLLTAPARWRRLAATAVPSTMGTLMASGFMSAGKALKSMSELDLSGAAQFFKAFLEGVQNRGKAGIGDKTFLDGLYPAVNALLADAEAGIDLTKGAKNAAQAAHEAFLPTKGMLAKHVRAAVADLMMKGYADFVANR